MIFVQKHSFAVPGSSAAALLLNGCSGSDDVSHNRAFSGAVGRELTTKRGTFVFHYTTEEAIPEYRKSAILTETHPPPGNIPWPQSRAEFQIPAGQPIRVTRFVKEYGDGDVCCDALPEGTCQLCIGSFHFGVRGFT
jgi:hypothetical protein